MNADGHRYRPIWSGMTIQELQDIRTKAADATLSPDISIFERTVFLLNQAVNIAVFRRINTPELATMKKLEYSSLGSMYFCSKYRNFW